MRIRYDLYPQDFGLIIAVSRGGDKHYYFGEL
jgi:hypothetical protein